MWTLPPSSLHLLLPYTPVFFLLTTTRYSTCIHCRLSRSSCLSCRHAPVRIPFTIYLTKMNWRHHLDAGTRWLIDPDKGLPLFIQFYIKTIIIIIIHFSTSHIPFYYCHGKELGHSILGTESPKSHSVFMILFVPCWSCLFFLFLNYYSYFLILMTPLFLP